MTPHRSAVHIARRLLLAALCVPAFAHAAAAPLLNALFQDHAVLQRDQPIRVWGEAKPGEQVTVTLAKSHARARADASGHWQASLPA
jgi:sialate O-acetylesterase